MSPSSFRHHTCFNQAAFCALAKVEFHAFWDTRFMLLSEIMMPFLYFLFIAIPLSHTIGNVPFEGKWIPYPNYVLVGLLAMNMMQQMTRVIYRMAVDRQFEFFALKMESGVSPLSYLFLMSISSLMGYTIQGFVFYLLNLCFGLAMPGVTFLLLWFVGLIGFFFWAGIAALITMHINDFQTRDAVVSFVIMPLSFSAPAFYVLQNAPSLIQYLAFCNPLTYQLEALREAAFTTLQFSTLSLVALCSLLSVAIATWAISRSSLLVTKGGGF